MTYDPFVLYFDQTETGGEKRKFFVPSAGFVYVTVPEAWFTKN